MRLLKPLLLGALMCWALQAAAAGLRQIEIPASDGQRAIAGVVWTPCAEPPVATQIGRYTLPAVRNCPVQGQRLSLVVISHGWHGTFLGHHDVAETLADAGFVVLAINHGDSAVDSHQDGDFAALVERPADIVRGIDFMLGQWQDAARIDASRIGFFGFSRGGYTGLVLAGANPVFGRMPQGCRGKEDAICTQARAGTLPPLAHDARIKAFVIADPLSVFFTGNSLDAVRGPLQLWRSERGGDGVEPAQVDAIARVLGDKAEPRVVPNSGHFAFLAPCPPAIASQAAALCSDASGFDRAAFHAQLDAAVLAFFQARLAPAP